MKLPVIVGMGGLNAAGRTSGFHNYKRMIESVLSDTDMHRTWLDLAMRMNLAATTADYHADLIPTIKHRTLVRRITAFNPEAVSLHHQARLSQDMTTVWVHASKLSPELLAASTVLEVKEGWLHVQLSTNAPMFIPDTRELGVSSAGQIPEGIELDQLYHAHHHPRGLKLTVYGMSDALNSLGFAWSDIFQYIAPDEVSVYAGSALSQIDEYSLAGLIGQPLMGHRVNSKMMPLSLAEMPADFINSYILNSVGATGHNVGACATFLYNLKLGIQDIQSGRARVVVVGGAEAPIVPQVIEGFRVMGALATDEALARLDGGEVHHRRACRPFSTNVGFTLGESSQFFILMDDALARALGATIYGAVADVFVHADGNKKSIASPGVGNYVTVAKALGLARAILGEKGLQDTYVQAHGTGTPQNRTTESHILNEAAKTFGLSNWAVSAVKAYVGHSIAVAGGDQLAVALGVWRYGWIPGITTIDHIAEDVHHDHLNILQDHAFVGHEGQSIRASILNSKGFGGNNATALILSPHEARAMIQQRISTRDWKLYQTQEAIVKAKAIETDAQTCEGKEKITYHFGTSVMTESSVAMTSTSIQLSECHAPISLVFENPYV